MNNIHVIFKGIFATLGGLISYTLGGFDMILITLVCCIVIDYISGVLKAIYEKKLSSEVGFRGIIKKAMIMLVVALTSVLQKSLADAVPLREIVIMFYIANEGISIIENLGTVIPLPEALKKFFEQLRGANNEK